MQLEKEKVKEGPEPEYGIVFDKNVLHSVEAQIDVLKPLQNMCAWMCAAPVRADAHFLA